MITQAFRNGFELFWAARVAVLLSRLSANEKLSENDPQPVAIHLNVVIQNDGSSFFATVPQLPGLAIDGQFRFETLYYTLEAIQAYLRSLKKHGEALPTIQNRLILEEELSPKTNVYGGTFWTSPTLLGVS